MTNKFTILLSPKQTMNDLNEGFIKKEHQVVCQECQAKVKEMYGAQQRIFVRTAIIALLIIIFIKIWRMKYGQA